MCCSYTGFAGTTGVSQVWFACSECHPLSRLNGAIIIHCQIEQGSGSRARTMHGKSLS